jgi:hypothetical protein
MGQGASYPSKLDALSGTTSSDGDALFGHDTNSTDSNAKLLDYPIYSKGKNGWRKVANNKYAFNATNIDVNFTYDPANGNFDCDHAIKLCKDLTE